MRGGKNDVLAVHQDRMSALASPQNIYHSPGLNPMLHHEMAVNHKAVLASQRNIPMAVITQPQTERLRLKNQEEQVFSYGGLAIVPPSGIWRGINYA